MVVGRNHIKDPLSLKSYNPSFSVAPGPVVISLSKTTFQTTISWSPPETPNGIIIAYEVSYLQTANPQNVTCINTTDQATNLSLHELQPETQYTFTVRAYTQAGAGEESIVMYTTSDRPGSSYLAQSYAILSSYTTICFCRCAFSVAFGRGIWLSRMGGKANKHNH